MNKDEMQHGLTDIKVFSVHHGKMDTNAPDEDSLLKIDRMVNCLQKLKALLDELDPEQVHSIVRCNQPN